MLRRRLKERKWAAALTRCVVQKLGVFSAAKRRGHNAQRLSACDEIQTLAEARLRANSRGVEESSCDAG
jgi:hypothetical protein